MHFLAAFYDKEEKRWQMFYLALPSDIRTCIVNQIRPVKFTPRGVGLCARAVIVLRGGKEKLDALKRIYDLVLRYSNYNQHAEHPKDFWRRTRLDSRIPFCQSIKPLTKGSPQLFTALSIGHHLFDSNYRYNIYTSKLEQDIKEIVELIPESLNFLFGDSHVDSCFLTPLAMACMNVKIPLYMIEFLLQRGASVHVPCKGAKKMVFFINHLGWGSLDIKRLEAIEKIFVKFEIGS